MIRTDGWRSRVPNGRRGRSASRLAGAGFALMALCVVASPIGAQEEAPPERGPAPIPVGAGFGSAEYSPDSQVPPASDAYLADPGVEAFFVGVMCAAWSCLEVLEVGPEPRETTVRLIIDASGSVAAGYITTLPTKVEVSRCLVRRVRAQQLPAPGEAVMVERRLPIDIDADSRFTRGIVRIIEENLPPDQAIVAMDGVEPALDTRNPGERERLLSLSIDQDLREPVRLPNWDEVEVAMFWTRIRTDIDDNPKIIGVSWDATGVPRAFFGVLLPPG
jgi:hypothetical protein